MAKSTKKIETIITKGYKVTDPDFQCRGFQYELKKIFTHDGNISLCNSGFHFCADLNDCFDYYQFDSKNRVFEIEAYGEIKTEGNKSCSQQIHFLRELTWLEVLTLVNVGKDNTGRSNSGDRNSGDRNSGDSNSGYRNSGAFCTDADPELILFNKPSGIKVKVWEQMEVCRLMYNIDTTLWVPASIMTDQEKKDNPKYEAPEGYLKTIPIKDAWQNMWHNLNADKKKLFTDLPNFDAAIFEEITSIKV